ncbi:cytosine permease [Leucobacter sp. OLJS4]|uniref:cytosine permease n=1 Tax=unclassified Leucobacter TaxID=2621730 RepID=UPI000C178FB1|nr:MULTISPECIES: cytosine permease [unclassified Leucobacter]PIJ37372.1 cytosine permease [Leucobacter sp. OLES1]PII85045.1 cytosine permease [Leucobacter sp. OLCALW19]PII89056.1 cytosine permease [Leucobacter sp. OLTLW20]PII93537.1 cytosine permease [Leucobacter sp. OLAS13]PII98067.1 cytosine permease [Leucobacter sp. OLDS2]
MSAGSTGTQQTTDAQAGSAPVDPDYPVTPVPQHARKGFFSLMVVLLGFTIFTPTMLAGASLGKAFGLSELLVVIALGSAVLGTYVAVLGWIGARTGLTTVVMARYTLGTRGSKLASVLLGGTQIGWYGVVVGTIGELTAQAFGWESYAAKAAVMIVVSALMCATAVYGYRGMYWVSLISTPLILILAFWVMFRSLDEVGGWAGLAAIHPSGSMPVAVAVTAVVGTFVSAGTQAPNWTRFGRSGGQAVLACVVGFLVGNGLMIFFGAIGAITFGEGDFVLVLFNLGMIGWGLFLLFGNLWKSNADAAYSFGVAGAELFNRPSKTRFVIFGSVIGTVLALVGVHQHLPQYLGLLGTFIPPLGGVIIGDYLARWRRTQMPEGEALPRFNWVNLGVYVVACAAAWVSGQFSFGIPPVIGIAVALLLSVALSKFGPQRPLAGVTRTIAID